MFRIPATRQGPGSIYEHVYSNPESNNSIESPFYFIFSPGLVAGAGGSFAPELAFKHWKPGNFLFETDMTQDEIKAAFDLPINATALGYYVNDAAALAKEPAGFRDYIKVGRSGVLALHCQSAAGRSTTP